MAKAARLAAVAGKLDEIEAELKAVGYWTDGPAPEKTGNFMEMPFEGWLQWVFLPNAGECAAADDLPAESQVGLMALRHYDYHDHIREAQRLVRLLHEFDDLVIRPA